MTGRAQTMADNETALLPKLRFPEFQGSDAWQQKPMAQAYSFMSNNSLSRDKLNYVSGAIKNVHYGDIHTKFSALFDITKETVPFVNESELVQGFRLQNDCAEGDVIFADASEDLEDIGKCIEVVRLNGERVVSGLHTILARPRSGTFATGFGAYLFRSEHVRKQIKKEAQGAKVLGLSATRLAKIELPLPPTKDEQQKIAECLSTLDELIGAESQKLDALKAHKKGLMQQLFPREGETLPRLRFPEFQDAPEWQEKEVGEVFTVTRGQVLAMPRVSETKSQNAPYPVYSSQTKHSGLCGFYSEFLYEDAITWTTDGANAGDVNFRSGKFYCTNVCGVLLSSDGYANPFVAALLNSVARKHVSYVGNPKLMNGVMAKIVIPFPSVPEQQRIASCLSSLDDLITAQSDKLEALKTHKKGLMQQLFPSPAALHGA